MLAQCNVSNNPYSRGPFTAGDVAAALRLAMDIAPPVVPSRYGPDDGVVFRRHQRASQRNGSRLDANGFDWMPAEDTDDRATDSGHAFNGEATLSRDDLKAENAPGAGDGPLDPVPLKEGGQHFRVIAPRATAMFIDHGPWSMGRHALPPRGRNLDLEKRSRAKLREECRFDPSAFARAVPADVWSRVTVSDKLAEANALLDAVDDKRNWFDWLTAPVDEPVVVKDYRTPKPRLRGRQHPGIAITGAGEDVLIVLLDADRALPPHAGARRNRHAH
jgi:hypothetical protein